MKRRLLWLAWALGLAGCGERGGEEGLVPGYLEADLVEIGSPEAGYLGELLVGRGQRVAADQELFRLDPTPLELGRLQAAAAGKAAQLRAEDAALGEREENIRRIEANLEAEQARLELARSEYERHEALVRGGAVSKSALQVAEAVYRQIRGNVSALQAELELARKGQRPLQVEALQAEERAADAARRLAAWKGEQVTRVSPEEAIVQDTLYEPGEWVAAGRPVVVLRRTRDLRARFYVPPEMLAGLRLGQPVEVVLPGARPVLRAAIIRISDQAEYTPPVIYSREESARLVFLVEAQLAPEDAAQLHPGLPVSVRLAAPPGGGRPEPAPGGPGR